MFNNTREIEVKFLNIDPKKIEARLVNIGANKQFDRIYKRWVFDYPDLRLHKSFAWVRLRDEGDRITLTYKQRQGVDLGRFGDFGMEEIEIIVSSAEKTRLLFLKLGFIEKFYEENRRIRYTLGDIEFDIDFWPLLAPYLEIESSSPDKITQAIKLLKLSPIKQKIFSTHQIYKMNGIDELDYVTLTFERQIKRKSL